MLQKIADYLKQPSTWRGIIGLAAVIGVTLSPEAQEAIIALAVSAVSAIEVLRNETKKAATPAA